MVTMGRKSLWYCGCITPLVIISAVIGFFCYSILLSWHHQYWCQGVEDRIAALAESCPKGLSPDQWAFCVAWTWNLHGNHGGYSDFDSSERDRFVAEFDRRLRGRVDLNTIDWIWDQYVEHSKGGAHYSRLYRPTEPNRLQLFRDGELGRYDLHEWLDTLRRVRERRAGKEAP
jgi:hypothetical protein